MLFYFFCIDECISLSRQSEKMNYHSPRIILLDVVRSFDTYVKMLDSAEKIVELFSRYALQVAIQRFGFLSFDPTPSVPLPEHENRSPFTNRYANDTLPKKVILLTHETDLKTGERYSLLGGKYFMDKMRPSLQGTDYVYGFYLN
jgi:hypothetical protein